MPESISKLSRHLSASVIDRLPLMVVAFATLMLFSLSYLAIDSSIKLVQESLTSKALAASSSISNKLTSELSNHANLIRSEASSPIVRNALADSEGLQSYLRPHLESLIQGYEALQSVVLIDNVGNVVVAVSKPGPQTTSPDLSTNTLFELIERGEPAYILDKQSSLTLTWPVLFPPTGRNEGVLLAKIDLQKITESATRSVNNDRDAKAMISIAASAGRAQAKPAETNYSAIPGNEFSFSSRIDLPPPFLSHLAEIEYRRSSIKERKSVINTIVIHAFSTSIAWLVFLILARWIKARYVEPIRKITAIATSFAKIPKSPLEFNGTGTVERLQNSVQSVIEVLNTTEHSYKEKIQFTVNELSQTRARLEEIARSGNIMAISVDLPTGVISYSTESISRYLKTETSRHKKNLISWKSIFRLVLREDRRKLKQGIRSCLRSGFARLPVKVRINDQDLVFDLRLQKAFATPGRVERIDCIAFDSTEVAEKEMALAQSEARKAAIINGALDGFIALNHEFIVMEVNPAAERILGKKNIALLGMRFVDHCIAPASMKQFLNFCSQLTNSKEGHHRHHGDIIWCRNANHQNIPVDLSGSLINMSSGLQICLYIKDLSKAFEQQRAITEKNAEIAAILELSPGGFASFNQNGVLSAYSKSLEDLLNLNPDFFSKPITQQSFEELVRQLTVLKPMKNMSKLIADGEKLLRISGPKEKLLKCAKRDAHAIGNRDSCVYYFTDISQEFQLDTLKSNFLATAAHELRTPLTTILGFSELMSTQNLSADVRKELSNSIFRHSLHLNSLISDLLDLSKIESEGANIFRPECINLADLLRDLVVKSSIQREGRRFVQDHEISIKIESCDELKTVADEEKLLRAFQNILSNATKYSAPESPIVITTSRVQRDEKDFIKVSVIDQGIGMTPEETEHAFVRFWRADSSSGKIPGTGLGLPLVKEIVDLHRGHIEIDSKFGKGTTVSVYLPAANQQS